MPAGLYNGREKRLIVVPEVNPLTGQCSPGQRSGGPSAPVQVAGRVETSAAKGQRSTLFAAAGSSQPTLACVLTTWAQLEGQLLFSPGIMPR